MALRLWQPQNILKFLSLMIINIISCNERRQRVLKFAIEAWQMPTEICVLPAPFVSQKKKKSTNWRAKKKKKRELNAKKVEKVGEKFSQLFFCFNVIVNSAFFFIIFRPFFCSLFYAFKQKSLFKLCGLKWFCRTESSGCVGHAGKYALIFSPSIAWNAVFELFGPWFCVDFSRLYTYTHI